jgi:hypothetical protein
MALEEYDDLNHTHDKSNQFLRSSSQKMAAFCSRRWYVAALIHHLQKLTALQQIQNPTAVCSTTLLADPRLKEARS